MAIREGAGARPGKQRSVPGTVEALRLGLWPFSRMALNLAASPEFSKIKLN
jgi:hypothetical protein